MPKLERKIQIYENACDAAKNAALDAETFSGPLRSYYAGVALHLDKRITKLKEEAKNVSG
jgi:hypothetical protein